MKHTTDAEPQVVKVRKQQLIPCTEGTTYKIDGKEYPVKCYMKVAGMDVPFVNIKMMSDYKWQYNALMSRLKNPDLYSQENTAEVIERLKQWLIENRHKAEPGDPIYTPEKAIA